MISEEMQKLIYDHQNDGTKIEDYTAGDFVVDKAGQNSS